VRWGRRSAEHTLSVGDWLYKGRGRSLLRTSLYCNTTKKKNKGTIVSHFHLWKPSYETPIPGPRIPSVSLDHCHRPGTRRVPIATLIGQKDRRTRSNRNRADLTGPRKAPESFAFATRSTCDHFQLVRPVAAHSYSVYEYGPTLCRGVRGHVSRGVAFLLAFPGGDGGYV
jgi:hypothetical protein